MFRDRLGEYTIVTNANVACFLFLFAAIIQFLDNQELMEQFDIQMLPTQESHLPVTMMCPWGKKPEDYLKKPLVNSKQKLVAFFNEHGLGKLNGEVLIVDCLR
jgi:hypothetical protein